MAKKKKETKVEPVVEPEPVAEDVEEITCPVCGKPVGLEVLACPHCGAEFESEEIEEIVEEEPAPAPQVSAPVRPAPAPAAESVSEEDMAECPVCGNSVSLSVAACPYCGAEFEEEEVEEVIEVEEEPAPAPAARARAPPVEVQEEEVAEVEVEEAEAEATAEEVVEEQPMIEPFAPEPPSSILDLRVIGVSLIILGIIGSQISFFIDWYWTWVPPIESHLGTFMIIPVVVIVAALLIFMLYKRSTANKKPKKRTMLPGVSLSIFLFGIIALIMILLWNPINDALQSSSIGVAGAFIAVIMFGVIAMFMGQKMNTRASAA